LGLFGLASTDLGANSGPNVQSSSMGRLVVAADCSELGARWPSSLQAPSRFVVRLAQLGVGTRQSVGRIDRCSRDFERLAHAWPPVRSAVAPW